MKSLSIFCFVLMSVLFISYSAKATPVSYSISLYDSWGDGWNGGSIDLSINSVLTLDDITLAYEHGHGPQSWDFSVDDGDFVEIDYSTGSWSSENSYKVFNNINELVLSSGLSGSTPQDSSFTVQIDNNVEPVPEPTTMLLLGAGILGMIGFGRKKFLKKS